MKFTEIIIKGFEVLHHFSSLKQMFESRVKMCLKAILTLEVWSLVTVFQDMSLLFSINIFEEQKILLGVSNWGKELKILHDICLNPVPKLSLICDFCSHA